MTYTIPVLFISHGSPMLALEEEPTTLFLRGLPKQFAKPKAIVVATAHWETAEPMITGSAQPETLHDFGGFPQALYALRYHAPGEPDLARRIQGVLADAGFKAGIDAARGLDHGVWDPLLVMYPDADIPVVALSVQPAQDARWHYRLGQALGVLRDEGVLIIGSGNLTHNLREAFRGQHKQVPGWVSAFAQWVAEKVAHNEVEALLEWKRLAPHALQNHPTAEHFLPFFIALGAAGFAGAERMNTETAMGVLAMDVYVFN